MIVPGQQKTHGPSHFPTPFTSRTTGETLAYWTTLAPCLRPPPNVAGIPAVLPSLLRPRRLFRTVVLSQPKHPVPCTPDPLGPVPSPETTTQSRTSRPPRTTTLSPHPGAPSRDRWVTPSLFPLSSSTADTSDSEWGGGSRPSTDGRGSGPRCLK